MKIEVEEPLWHELHWLAGCQHHGGSGVQFVRDRSTRSCLGHQSRLVVASPTRAWLNGHLASLFMGIYLWTGERGDHRRGGGDGDVG